MAENRVKSAIYEIKPEVMDSPMEPTEPNQLSNTNIYQPAAEPLPNQILNMLNDDCIHAILRRLKNIRDFANAAQVCVRFQENAKQCPQPKSISFDSDGKSSSPNALYPNQLVPFLQTFGDSVQSIIWLAGTRNMTKDVQVLQLITRFCHSTLTTFRIHDHHINFGIHQHFTALQVLELTFGSVRNICNMPNLRTLILREVYTTDFNWMQTHFTHLTSIEFFRINHLMPDLFIYFISLNQQIVKLKITGSPHISSVSFREIATYLPNLTDFTYVGDEQDNFEDDLMHLTNLRQLKSLAIGSRDFSARHFIETLAENNIPIENLLIDGGSSDVAASINKLKLIKKLILILPNLSENAIFGFTDNLTSLENMIVTTNHVTTIGLKRMLRSASLATAVIYTHQVNARSEDYRDILTLAQNRVKLQVAVVRGNINLPTDITTEERQWLNIHRAKCIAFAV